MYQMPTFGCIQCSRVYNFLIICQIFQIKKFKHLVKTAFPHTEMKKQTVENMRDFVRGCISLNPKDRPSIDEVLQHKVFGGPKLFPQKKNDVWINKGESRLRLNKLTVSIFFQRDI